MAPLVIETIEQREVLAAALQTQIARYQRMMHGATERVRFYASTPTGDKARAEIKKYRMLKAKAEEMLAQIQKEGRG